MVDGRISSQPIITMNVLIQRSSPYKYPMFLHIPPPNPMSLPFQTLTSFLHNYFSKFSPSLTTKMAAIRSLYTQLYPLTPPLTEANHRSQNGKVFIGLAATLA